MTHVMVKGSNIPVDATGVRAVLRWTPGPAAPDVDASVLLLGADGRVRSDADFVFYNEPRHPSGLARHLPKKRVPEGLTDTVEVDLAALDAGVDRVVLAASSDGGPFRLVRDLRLELYDTSAGQAPPVIVFDVVPDTGHETALICGELYRRGADWKFRALGQGYATGLVGLATEFGITVDDGEPDSSGSAPSVPSAAPAPVPSGSAGLPAQPAQPAPVQPRAAAAAAEPDSVYGYPLPAPAPGHVPAQPAYGYPQPVAARPAAAAPATAPPPRPAAPPAAPAAVSPGPYPAYGYPHPVAAPPYGGDGFALPPQGPQFQPGR